MISSMRAIFSRVDSPGGSAIYSLQLLGALKEMAPCCQRERTAAVFLRNIGRKEEIKREWDFTPGRPERSRRVCFAFIWWWPCAGDKRESAGLSSIQAWGGTYLYRWASSHYLFFLHYTCSCGRRVRKKRVTTVEIQLINAQITSCECIVPGLLVTKAECRCHWKLILTYILVQTRRKRKLIGMEEHLD